MIFDEQLSNQLLELIAYYFNRGCTCAFPRFRALIGLGLPVIILEKESLIKLARANYTVSDFSERNDKHEHWICNTCRSSFYASYTPLHIMPNRWEDATAMMEQQLNCTDIGKAAEKLVPLCLSTIPPIEAKDLVRTVTNKEFFDYMRQLHI